MEDYEPLRHCETKLIKKYYLFSVLAKPCLLLSFLLMAESMMVMSYDEAHFYILPDDFYGWTFLLSLLCLILFFVFMLIPYFGMKKTAWKEIVEQANADKNANVQVESLVELQKLQNNSDKIGDLKPKTKYVKGILKRVRYGTEELADYYDIKLPNVRALQISLVAIPLIIVLVFASVTYLKEKSRQDYLANIYSISREKIANSFEQLGFDHVSDSGYGYYYGDYNYIYCERNNDYYDYDQVMIRVNTHNQITQVKIQMSLLHDDTPEESIKKFNEFVELGKLGIKNTELEILKIDLDNDVKLSKDFADVFVNDQSKDISMTAEREIEKYKKVYSDFRYRTNQKYASLPPYLEISVDYYE